MKNLNEDILLLTSKYSGSVTRCATLTNVTKYAASNFKEQGCRNHIKAIISLKLFLPSHTGLFLQFLENQVILTLETMEDAEFTALIF